MAIEYGKIRENEKKAKEKFIVEYEKEFYDITDFMHKHPGNVTTRKRENLLINSILIKVE